MTTRIDQQMIPMRPKEPAEIVCMVRGEVTIDLRDIKWLQSIKAGRDVTTQIYMATGESYYIRGKDQFQVAEELGIVLGVA